MSRNPTKVVSEWIADYRSLLGEKSWKRLHPDIQKRFSSDAAHRPVTYTGAMEEVFLSFSGRLLAQLCRTIGTPLALYPGKDIPMKVKVYPNYRLGGMTWERHYLYSNKKINCVKSTKCVRKDTGLIEVVGFGFGMSLKIVEREQALFFESTRFFWQVGKVRIPIPHILTPGKTVVCQRALEGGRFRFSLDVVHPILGKVFFQTGVFEERS